MGVCGGGNGGLWGGWESEGVYGEEMGVCGRVGVYGGGNGGLWGWKGEEMGVGGDLWG